LTATCVDPIRGGMIYDALNNDYGSKAIRYSSLSAAIGTTLGALPGSFAVTSAGDVIPA
jgi:hypothetical protein